MCQRKNIKRMLREKPRKDRNMMVVGAMQGRVQRGGVHRTRRRELDWRQDQQEFSC
jgi:hypothetical protein